MMSRLALLPDEIVYQRKPVVAVVGAGYSGIESARQLAAKGYHVYVFEANPKPCSLSSSAHAGRAHTTAGHYLKSYDLAQQIMTSVFQSHAKHDLEEQQNFRSISHTLYLIHHDTPEDTIKLIQENMEKLKRFYDELCHQHDTNPYSCSGDELFEIVPVQEIAAKGLHGAEHIQMAFRVPEWLLNVRAYNEFLIREVTTNPNITLLTEVNVTIDESGKIHCVDKTGIKAVLPKMNMILAAGSHNFQLLCPGKIDPRTMRRKITGQYPLDGIDRKLLSLLEKEPALWVGFDNPVAQKDRFGCSLALHKHPTNQELSYVSITVEGLTTTVETPSQLRDIPKAIDPKVFNGVEQIFGQRFDMSRMRFCIGDVVTGAVSKNNGDFGQRHVTDYVHAVFVAGSKVNVAIVAMEISKISMVREAAKQAGDVLEKIVKASLSPVQSPVIRGLTGGAQDITREKGDAAAYAFYRFYESALKPTSQTEPRMSSFARIHNLGVQLPADRFDDVQSPAVLGEFELDSLDLTTSSDVERELPTPPLLFTKTDRELSDAGVRGRSDSIVPFTSLASLGFHDGVLESSEAERKKKVDSRHSPLFGDVYDWSPGRGDVYDWSPGRGRVFFRRAPSAPPEPCQKGGLASGLLMTLQDFFEVHVMANYGSAAQFLQHMLFFKIIRAQQLSLASSPFSGEQDLSAYVQEETTSPNKLLTKPSKKAMERTPPHPGQM